MTLNWYSVRVIFLASFSEALKYHDFHHLYHTFFFLSENAAENEEEEKGRMVIHAIERAMVLG